MPVEVIAPQEAAIGAALLVASALGMVVLALLHGRRQQLPFPRWILYLPALGSVGLSLTLADHAAYLWELQHPREDVRLAVTALDQTNADVQAACPWLEPGTLMYARIERQGSGRALVRFRCPVVALGQRLVGRPLVREVTQSWRVRETPRGWAMRPPGMADAP